MKNIIKIASFLFSLLAIAGLTGCGGDSSWESSTDLNKSLHLITNGDAVAFKAKDDDWRVDFKSIESLNRGFKKYTFEKSALYSVAINCKESNSTLVAALTPNDGELRFDCRNESNATTINIKGSLEDNTSSSEPDDFALSIGTQYTIDSATPFNYNLHVTEGLYDIVAVSLYNTATEPINPIKFHIERNINLTANLEKNITITNANSCNAKDKNFTKATGVDGRVVLITENNTYFTSSMGNHWYYPDCAMNDQDIFAELSKNDANKTYRMHTFGANSAKKDIKLDTSLIKPLTEISYSDSGTMSGFANYTPESNVTKLGAFEVDLSNGSQNYFILLSKGYLGSNNTFTVDDLSGVTGFESVWDGTSASEVEASALMSNVKIEDIVSSSRKINLADFHYNLVQNAIIEIAEQKVK